MGELELAWAHVGPKAGQPFGPLGPWHFQDSPRGSRDKGGHSGVENLKCQRPGCQRGPNTRAQPIESRLRDGLLGDLRTTRPGVSASPLVPPLLSCLPPPPQFSQFCVSPLPGCWLATVPLLLRVFRDSLGRIHQVQTPSQSILDSSVWL